MKIPALILAVGMMASAVIGSVAYYQGKTLGDTLEVTGSARRQIVSDRAKWSAEWDRDVTVTTLKDGYRLMADDEKKVRAFFASHGVKDSAIEVAPVSMDQDYTYNQQDPSVPKRFILRQTVELRSDDVAAVTALSKQVNALIDQGVVFSSKGVEYTYSDLPTLRVSLLGEAVKDAEARTEAIAGKGNVGPMRSATVGVVQVVPVGSTDVSDYGAYDTSKIDKEVMVTVRAAFSMRK